MNITFSFSLSIDFFFRYVGHTSSIEDIQWSHTEENVFAACSADCSVRIFDVRRKANSMLCIEGAHTQDVNVISWNPLVGFLLASGSDDGGFKIWDLRKVRQRLRYFCSCCFCCFSND